MPKPALPTLIKLAAKEVDAIQQRLATNRQEQQAQEKEIANWQQEAATAFATAVADDDVRSMQAAGLFQQRARSEVARAEAALGQLRQVEAELRAQLQEAFTKQKRYEILAAQQQEKAKRTASRKAQAVLDDLRRPS